MRLHENDLQARAWINGSGWPFGLDELDADYAAAERWLGLSGRRYGPARWSEHPETPALPWSDDKMVADFTEYTPWPDLAARHGRQLVQHRALQ